MRKLGQSSWQGSHELGRLVGISCPLVGGGWGVCILGRAAPPSGRYSHVAAVLGGSVLLVAGGYSGRPRGDLMAYKVPPFVFQAPAPDVSTGEIGRGWLLGVGGNWEEAWFPGRWEQVGVGAWEKDWGSLGLRAEWIGVLKVSSSWGSLGSSRWV